MTLFGSSWLDEPIDDDSPMFGRNLLDERHFEYFINNEGYVQDSGGNCDVRYINVSAEAVNYTPVLFTDIVKYLEYVSFKKMNISFNEFLTKVEILRLLNQ